MPVKKERADSSSGSQPAQAEERSQGEHSKGSELTEPQLREAVKEAMQAIDDVQLKQSYGRTGEILEKSIGAQLGMAPEEVAKHRDKIKAMAGPLRKARLAGPDSAQPTARAPSGEPAACGGKGEQGDSEHEGSGHDSDSEEDACGEQQPATGNDEALGPAAEPCKDAQTVLPAGTGEAGPAGVAAAVAGGSVQRKGGGRRKQQPPKKKTQLVTKKRGSRKAAAAAAETKKPHRYRPGTVALREIRKMQRSTELLIRKLPFHRVVRDITEQCSEEKIKWTGEALLAAQEAVEAVLTTLLGAGNLCAIHAKRVTLMPKDLQLVKRILKDFGMHIFQNNK
ncbi:hypothetical protein N2152v2_008090 [Parachlorella kessleri]